MKKLLAIALLSAVACAAHAGCAITSVRDGNIATKFKKYGGWSFDEASFDRLCEKLSRARARIQINADATVLVNQSVAWAVLSVVDRDTGIGTSDYASMHTQVNSYASQDKADEMMVQAINAAAQNWEGVDAALASLEEERNKVKAMMAKRK